MKHASFTTTRASAFVDEASVGNSPTREERWLAVPAQVDTSLLEEISRLRRANKALRDVVVDLRARLRSSKKRSA